MFVALANRILSVTADCKQVKYGLSRRWPQSKYRLPRGDTFQEVSHGELYFD